LFEELSWSGVEVGADTMTERETGHFKPIFLYKIRNAGLKRDTHT
jgi:hypothetical protein